MIKADSLDALNDNDLMEITERAQALLKKRDEERKAKALSDARTLRAKAESDARTLLESVGLSLKSLSGKARKKGVQASLI